MRKLWVLFATIIMMVLLAFSANAGSEGYLSYSVSNDEATITRVPTYASGDIVIPDTLGGYPVVAIADSAFNSCEKITSVTIPDSVTYIGTYAFGFC